MNLTPELLFVGGFILVVVLFIQYISYSKLKKMVRTPRAKPESRQNRIHATASNPIHNPVNNTQQINETESIEIDTPDDDVDSYVNPVHSEKNIDDEIEEK